MAILDSTNLAILRELRDGRKPFSEVARSVGVTENTVRSRVTRMQDEGILSIAGQVDPELIDGLDVIFVGVKLATMRLSEKALELSRLPGVVSASVVTGRFDVILVVLLTASFGLLEFYSTEIARVDEIQSVETFVVYQGYNMRVPMIDEALR